MRLVALVMGQGLAPLFQCVSSALGLEEQLVLLFFLEKPCAVVLGMAEYRVFRIPFDSSLQQELVLKKNFLRSADSCAFHAGWPGQ